MLHDGHYAFDGEIGEADRWSEATAGCRMNMVYFEALLFTGVIRKQFSNAVPKLHS